MHQILSEKRNWQKPCSLIQSTFSSSSFQHFKQHVHMNTEFYLIFIIMHLNALAEIELRIPSLGEKSSIIWTGKKKQAWVH